jgi:protein involved in polysaccharide export with SLBB domain
VQVLSEAGVGSDVADLSAVKITRKRRDGKSYSIKVNVLDVIERDDFEKNLLVKAGDIIYVPPFASLTQTAYVYVLGRVNSPGRYGFIPGREVMTFTKVLALAGDFHQFAKQSSVKILRKEHNRTRIIEVDFSQIIENEIEDPELMPDDIIYVPESFF